MANSHSLNLFPFLLSGDDATFLPRRFLLLPHCCANSCHPRTLLQEAQPVVHPYGPLLSNAPWSSGLVLISHRLSAPYPKHRCPMLNQWAGE